MKQLLALFAIILTVSSAHAQADKTPAVTKLPGEEKLSIRERAERDFLMPVRRKQIAADAPKAANEDITASPETDANNVTAHANAPVTDEVRTVEEAAAPARDTRIVHSTRAHAARRVHHTTRSTHAKSSSKKHSTHSSKKSSSKAHSKSSSKKSSTKKASSKKSSAHKSSKSSSAKKSSHKRRR
ncbi:hypothetical protein Q5H93_07320 [Hymenobacter sp. ASUV-10]|uniref:Uncharacterized protein n=1 Tax=Hymenobacter aranciens TaxID=3063996 RepID=A0ABT9B8D1_9BACT|nr:hypothetical protein [Hymenobacter sp. ASUV-10]MDO7874536.1 hypothetical protein [Hymenobacter sp. ASUV-10]